MVLMVAILVLKRTLGVWSNWNRNWPIIDQS